MLEPVTIPETELVANVRRSTDTALRVLRHLEQSFERGGFAAGVPAYEQMAATLAGQRVWSLDKNDGDIERNFRELATAAGRVHAMLAPYARIMERIGALGAVAGAGAPAPETAADDGLTPDQRSVLGELRGSRQPLTTSGLRARTGLASRRLRTVLDQLQALGRVRASGPEQRRRYLAAP